MKKVLSSCFRNLVVLVAVLFLSNVARANHIVGLDLNYAWVSGNTYKITLVVYGDCSGGAAYDSLPTATPQICIYNGATSVGNLTLAVQAPATGVNVSAVCTIDTGLTTCSGGTYIGIKKYTYSGNYTVTGTSHYWRFIFDGSLGHTQAGRATTITNIATGTTSMLTDTLDNTYHVNNSSPNLTVSPTPYYCLNNADNYSPGAIDPDGDSLHFYLSPGIANNAASCAGAATAGSVTYSGGFTATNPLSYTAGTFSFNTNNGQIGFTPNITQRALVVYSIREYRNDTFIGTSQREMTFLVQTCSNSSPYGGIASATNGLVIDSTDFQICPGSGPFSLTINPTEVNPTGLITVDTSGLPVGSTINITGNGTHSPVVTFNWTSTAVAPGLYTFYLFYKDNNCPISGTNTYAINVDIANLGTINGSDSVCKGSTTTLTNTTPGGVWSSSNTAVATISTGGVVTGVSNGTSTISYSVGTCFVTVVVTVNSPAAIATVPATVCLLGTTTLTDGTAGGTWSSSAAGVASISTAGVVTGVAVGTATISYTKNTCSATTVVTVNNAPVAILPAAPVVCSGNTITLTDATGGGVWTSTNTAVATVSGGTVSGVSGGTSTISYAIGTCVSTTIITVNATPAAIAAVPVTICLGGTVTLTDGTVGGVWSSATTTVATISTAGLVTGAGVGTSTISYTKAGCSATTVATVNTAPVAILPAAPVVCSGNTITLTDATGGGVWSSTNTAVATISGGTVTGVTGGTSTISYAIGTCASTTIVTVNATPVAIATVPATVCLGGTVTLTDGTVGGVWSSTTTSVATISTAGLVTGAGVGTSTISYTKTGCSATTVVTVNTAPVAILPAAPVVCSGSTITLTDATGGGVWSSTNTAVATVSGGTVTGVTGGTSTISYAIGTCVSTTIVTVNTTPSAITPVPVSLCLGGTVTLSDVTVGGVWSSSAAGVASVGTGGLVTAAGVGTATISYTKAGCSATTVASVNNAPGALSPTSAIVCTGNTTTFTDATGGGVWSSSASGVASVAGGVVTGVSVGTATITYAIGTCTATAPVTVNLSPNAGTITGPSDVCPGNNITLTDGAAGGVWSAGNGNATVAGGVVSGITLGTDVISYTVSTACGSASALFTVNIAVTGSGLILGPNTICVGSFDIYLDTTGVGTWSLTNGNGVISSVGVVTALTTGADTIVYTSAGACAATTKAITIVPATGGGTITGPTSVCVASNITLSDAVAPGGTWSASNGHATVGLGTGVVTGVSAGLDTIKYIVTTACGTYTNTATVNVDASSTPSPVSGPSSVCATSSITLSDADAGGIFSSSNGNATVVSGSGVVTGVLPGMDTITYTVINGCGLGSTTKVITITPAPSAGTITGPSSVCVGAAASFTDAISGGTWSITNGNATITSGGSVIGITAGTDTIIYTITAGCGTVSSTKIITISPLPNAGSVTGPDSVCIGSSITLTDAVGGGIWSAGNGNATVTGGGVVTGVAAGTVPVSYAVTNSCGTNYALQVVNVVGMPNAGVITGISNVCIGAAITLIDTVPGGIWLSSNGNASIIGPGIVSGVTTGIDSIFYVVINSCGTVEARKIINVNPSPVIPAIVGATSQCVGTTITLTDGLAGGNWTSSNTAVAVAGMSTGSITGASAGIVTISYTVTNAFGCPATVTAPDTVNIIPVVAAPAGASSVCMLSSVALTDATAGGVWSSSNTAIATVDAIGNVTGVAAGGVTISYTVTNMCGATSGTIAFIVNPLPVVGVIAGTTNECIGSSTTLTDIPAGGTWGSLDTAIATVNSATGVVTGITPGIATIIYSITNTFGCVTTVSAQDTVAAPSAVLPIAGATNECIGSITTLTDGTGGGVWSSSDNTIATVDATGKVFGIAGGVVTISYSVTNLSGCISSATMNFTVNIMPVASPIMGSGSVCQGGIDSLSNATSGGAWSSSDVTIATIDPVSGALTGVGAGNVTIKYNIVNSCGSVTDSVVISVIAAPVVAPITALYSSICSGSNITVSDATAGGAWSTSNVAIATIGSTGVVTSLSVGVVTISYTVTNVSGCATSATYVLTVTAALPGVDVVPATGTLCHGNPVNMHVSTAVAGVTYQWLLNGNAIAGATNSGYVADSAGTYSLVISNGLCSETLPGTVVSGPPAPVVSFMTPDILYTGSFFSYQWYKDGAAISGATTSLVHETGPGAYMVVVTDINGCTDTGSYSVPWISTSVAGVTAGSSIRVYPNPTTSLLTIDAPVKVNASVLSIDGKTLIEQKAATSIDVSSLASGMYMIMIYDENNLLLMTSKFVKEGQ